MNITRSKKFDECIAAAGLSLRNISLEQAYKLIIEAFRTNPDSPEPHNLLGIWFELRGEEDKARRHYRAAYSLDPSYTPACKNLERICGIFGNIKLHPYAYGDQAEEEDPKANGKIS